MRGIGGAFLANGSRVKAWLEPGEPGEMRTVRALVLENDSVPPLGNRPGPTGRGVSGSQPWISLLCKFSDVPAQPRDLAYFSAMFDNTPGRLDHYWREVSYDAANVAGSTAAGWVALPQPQTFYVPVPGSGCLDGIPGNDANLAALFNDCTAAADPLVDFSAGGTGGFGINRMFNSDPMAALGRRPIRHPRRVTKTWRTTGSRRGATPTSLSWRTRWARLRPPPLQTGTTTAGPTTTRGT